ncbi:MAG: HDOD domain-containing protein [Opitutaceae bacterium]
MTDGTTPPMPGAFSPDDIVRDVKQLPSAPKVLPRLKQLLSDTNSAMHEIVALIRLDPGIAARVLQTANSAYFNSKGVRCIMVDEAVQRVGYDEVYELVAYAVASQVLVRPLEAYGLDADTLWQSSVACAIAAELLAVRTNQDPNIAYTIGLLHRVGMVAIDEWALKQAPGLKLTPLSLPREATEAERATLGFTQAEVGGALLRHWNFPPAMFEPVRRQYAPNASSGHAKMASLLLAAKWLRSAVNHLPLQQPPLPEPSQLVSLGILPVDLQGMVGEVEAQLADVSSLLAIASTKAPFNRADFPSATFDHA